MKNTYEAIALLDFAITHSLFVGNDVLKEFYFFRQLLLFVMDSGWMDRSISTEGIRLVCMNG